MRADRRPGRRSTRCHYKDEKGSIKPQYVIEEINRITKGEAIICTDVGQHQMWAAQFYTYNKPRQFITSGGLGTMGFGFPAAIGAKVGRPDKTVIDIAGDGSFQMNIQELATAVCYDIPVIVCILNNGYLGMVRQWQELFWNKRYSETVISASPISLQSRRPTGRWASPSPRRRTSPTPSRPPSSPSGRRSSISGSRRRKTSSRWCRRGSRSTR